MAQLSHEFENSRPLLDPLKFAEDSRDGDILNLVRAALTAGRARLAIQPVVHAGDLSKPAFYEGLIRVLDHKGRILPAGHFMPMIEDSDLGRQIDVASLHLAFQMLGRNPSMHLSINVSARSLGDSRWRRVLNQGLARKDAPGNRLIFEISEKSAMLLPEILMQFMEEVQPKGIGFAIDSFGAGLTSFRHLRDLMFDVVKIDKSFAKRISENVDNQVLVEALVDLSKQFGMVAVADGVESKADADFLVAVGSDCLQGYHFGVPKFLKS